MRNSAFTAKLEWAVPVFAALGDPTRARVVLRLCEQGPMSIAELASGAEVTRQAITKHLEVLEDAGLVKSRREGRSRICELEQKRLEIASRYLELVSKRWDDALERLRKRVED